MRAAALTQEDRVCALCRHGRHRRWLFPDFIRWAEAGGPEERIFSEKLKPEATKQIYDLKRQLVDVEARGFRL
jgi:hypothetical protein